MANRKYDQEFKREAVKLAQEQGVTKTAQNLGIRTNLIYRWRKEMKIDQEEAFRGNGRLKAEAEEIRKLKRELAQVKQEREILKKALAIVNRE